MYSVEVVVKKDGQKVGADSREIDEKKYLQLAHALRVLQGRGQDAYNKAFYDAYQEAGIDPFPPGGGEDKDLR